MKTWICKIYGGGTPLYLVSAEDEKRAWELIKKALREKGYWDTSFSLVKRSGGLVEFTGWTSEKERIVDIQEVYAPNGTIKDGTYKGL